MKLSDAMVTNVENELLTDDPYACNLPTSNVTIPELDMVVNITREHDYANNYNDYLITCFLLLLEAHDSCQ